MISRKVYGRWLKSTMVELDNAHLRLSLWELTVDSIGLSEGQ